MTSSQDASFTLARLSEREMNLFAQLVASNVQSGDLITLHGEVGAGKTTFARALITAMLGGVQEEIPSPTYTLVQTYETLRMRVSHFDLYRLGDPSELGELGLDHALSEGLAVVEWPSRAGDALPETRLELHLGDPLEAARCGTSDKDENARSVRVVGRGELCERARRLEAMRRLVDEAGWAENLCAISYLAGDASARRYARLVGSDDRRALLMDWPRQPAGKVVKDGKSYEQIAHIAGDVTAFVAIANFLRDHGLSAPEIYAADVGAGLLLLEDFGERVFGEEVGKGVALDELWRVATDTLVALRAVPVPKEIPVAGVGAGAGVHVVPRFDRDAMAIEVELLLEWYWPSVHGALVPADERKRFMAQWDKIFSALVDEPVHWILRDYHSPNLVWLPDRSGTRRVGVIDFQDGAAGPVAYDLVSLLQDARLDVPAELEARLFEHYCAGVRARDPNFDQNAFALSYAALGAQRNTKILGIFARLAARDGKSHYLAHVPRVWGYLRRNLQHPGLSDLASWYETAFGAQY